MPCIVFASRQPARQLASWTEGNDFSRPPPACVLARATRAKKAGVCNARSSITTDHSPQSSAVTVRATRARTWASSGQTLGVWTRAGVSPWSSLTERIFWCVAMLTKQETGRRSSPLSRYIQTRMPPHLMVPPPTPILHKGRKQGWSCCFKLHFPTLPPPPLPQPLPPHTWYNARAKRGGVDAGGYGDGFDGSDGLSE